MSVGVVVSVAVFPIGLVLLIAVCCCCCGNGSGYKWTYSPSPSIGKKKLGVYSMRNIFKMARDYTGKIPLLFNKDLCHIGCRAM